MVASFTIAISMSSFLADELGFDGVCVNEHHQNAYGTDAVAEPDGRFWRGRPSGLKIAVIGNALPMYNPPMRWPRSSP